MGYHMLDLMVDLFNQPLSIKGSVSYMQQHTVNDKLEDTAIFTLRHNEFLQGVICLIRNTIIKKETIAIYGSNKTILASKNNITITSTSDVENLVIQEEYPSELTMLKIYIDNILYKKDCIEHLQQHLWHIETIKSIYDLNDY